MSTRSLAATSATVVSMPRAGNIFEPLEELVHGLRLTGNREA